MVLTTPWAQNCPSNSALASIIFPVENLHFWMSNNYFFFISIHILCIFLSRLSVQPFFSSFLYLCCITVSMQWVPLYQCSKMRSLNTGTVFLIFVQNIDGWVFITTASMRQFWWATLIYDWIINMKKVSFHLKYAPHRAIKDSMLLCRCLMSKWMIRFTMSIS